MFASREPTRMSFGKHIERRIVCAWKSLSRRGRRHYRASILLPDDFVLLTSRRRSVRYV